MWHLYSTDQFNIITSTCSDIVTAVLSFVLEALLVLFSFSSSSFPRRLLMILLRYIKKYD